MQLCNIEMQVSGLFRIEKFKRDDQGVEIPGTRTVAADWFPNLILDQGLNYMATLASYVNACQVGTGTTTPASGQTALASYLAGTTATAGSTVTTSASSPYYVALTRTFRFSEGAVVGNIAEVGIGTLAASGTNLFSRSLIKDGSGNPTTITILADESLDVIYQLRYYAPLTDVTGTIVATGNIGGTYDYTLRAANVTSVASANAWNLPASQGDSGTTSGYRAYTGTIGAITSGPSGTTGDMSSPTAAAYTNGTFYRDRVVTASAAQANLAGGIRSMLLKLGIGAYQIQFDPAIPKTATDVVQLTLRLSWGRRP